MLLWTQVCKYLLETLLSVLLGIYAQMEFLGWRMKWLDGITDAMDMSWNKLWEMVKDREAWHALLHRVAKNRTWLSDWTTAMLALFVISRATAVLLSPVAAPPSVPPVVCAVALLAPCVHQCSSPVSDTGLSGLCGIFVAALATFLVQHGISRYNWGVQTLCCGLWDPVPWREMESGPPALGSWSLSHWTTSVVPPWCCLFSILLMVPFLTDVRWCLIVVLIFVPVMVSDVQHLFSSCWPFLWRNVYSSFSPTLNWVVLLLSFRSSLPTQHIRYTNLQVFSHILRFFSYFVCGDKIIKFSWTPICFFFCCMFCCCSVDKLCWTLCNPVDWGTPGFPVLHYLPEFAQTHVRWIGDAIQPSHSLSPPFSSGPQSFPASGSLLMSQFFASDGQSTGALASVLPMNI